MPRKLRNSFPLARVATALGVAVAALLGWARWLAPERPAYEFARDFVLPLVGPLVAIVIPILIFHILPMAQTRHHAALALFQEFFREEMRIARRDAWQGMIAARHAAGEPAGQQRLDQFLRYYADPEAGRRITPEDHELFQKAARVLEFFALTESLLQRNAVERGLVKSFLSYYYLTWSEDLLAPLRNRPWPRAGSAGRQPPWLVPLAELDRLCANAE